MRGGGREIGETLKILSGRAALLRIAVCFTAAFLLLTGGAVAETTGTYPAELPPELGRAAPDAAAEFWEEGGVYGPEAFAGGVARIWARMRAGASGVLRQRVRGAAAVLFVVLLCAAVRNLGREGEGSALAVSFAGALAVSTLSAGSLHQLIGLGWETVRDLNAFSAVLLPILAAATAASGAVTAASFQQTAAVFLAEALISLIDTLLMPMTYLYIGVLTASCALGGGRLDPLAAGLKRSVTGILTVALLGFTAYLSVFHVIAGPVDAAAVRTAKAAISSAVPVVGGVIAEVSEAMLAGAGVLRASIGVFGMLAVLSACAAPFLQLGIQYLLYKAVSVLASLAGAPELSRLIDGLGGAFALVLGMTGTCALLLLIAVLSFVSAVTP